MRSRQLRDQTPADWAESTIEQRCDLTVGLAQEFERLCDGVEAVEGMDRFARMGRRVAGELKDAVRELRVEAVGRVSMQEQRDDARNRNDRLAQRYWDLRARVVPNAGADLEEVAQ